MSNTLHATESQADWIDLNQFERLYPYSRRQVWYWIAENAFPIYRPTRRKILLRRSEIDRFLESKKVASDINKIVDEVISDLGVGK